MAGPEFGEGIHAGCFKHTSGVVVKAGGAKVVSGSVTGFTLRFFGRNTQGA